MKIELATIQNIRDLGGMKTTDGRTVRDGCLIRSAHLGNASSEDLTKLRNEHRLHTVIDLRTAGECREHPDRHEGIILRNLPIIESFEAGITHEAKTEDMPFPDLEMLYEKMVTSPETQRTLGIVLHEIIEHDYSSGAVLWHCSEGKDRCGLTAVLVEMVLGISREDIQKDYLMTNETNLDKALAQYHRIREVKGEMYAQCVYNAYIADKRYLNAALKHMPDDYPYSVLGISQTDAERFRNQVLI